VNRRFTECPACGHPTMLHYGGPCYCGCAGTAVREVADEVDVPSAEPAVPPNHMQQMRATYPRAYERWSQDEEAALRFFYQLGSGVDAIAAAHERQPSAIVARLIKVGLIEPEPGETPAA
jgi:uncharacterized Zn finger protein (UPF0148 family)